MKAIIHKTLLLITSTIAAIALTGCGGGGGAIATPSAVFDLSAVQNNLYKGASFDLSGTDAENGKYTGTMTFSDQGTQDVNGVLNATHIKLDLSITNTITNTSTTGSQDLYFTSDYAPVLEVDNRDGATYTPTTSTALPKSAMTGDSGDLPSFSVSDGTTESGTWTLKSATDGRAKLTFDITTRDAADTIVYQETDSITIDSTGNVLAIKVIMTDPSSSGTTLTLSGNNQLQTLPSTVFDLSAAQYNLYNGANFDLSGVDTLGETYTATMAFSNLGDQIVQGVNATQFKLDIDITNDSTHATTQETHDLFFMADYAPVLEIVNPGNLTCLPMPLTVTTLPPTALMGESGQLTSYTLSDGTTETGTWQLDSGTNGRAMLIFNITIRDTLKAVVAKRRTAITVDATGTVYALRLKMTDSSGTELTLAGNML